MSNQPSFDVIKLFKELCLTQELRQGRFKSFLDRANNLVCKNASFRRSFLRITDNFERVQFVLSQEPIRRAFEEIVKTIDIDNNRGKDSTLAAKHRLDGNRAYSQNRVVEAVALYSEAIRYAPEMASNDEDAELVTFLQELPLSYGNRSAAFFHLRHYENALKDIEAALAHGYERVKKPATKLMIRMGECLLQLGRFVEAKKALEMAKPSDASDIARWTFLMDQVEPKLRNYSQNKELQPNGNDLDNKYRDISLYIEDITKWGCFNPQSKLNSLSTKVAIRYDAKNGRHLVATENINFGDSVAVSQPYASVLSQYQEGHFCHHCLIALSEQQKKQKNVAMPRSIPCSHCSYVLYCSEHCRTQSWKSYHQIECPMLCFWRRTDYVLFREAHLALRVLLVACNEKDTGLDNIRRVTQKFKQFKMDPCTATDLTGPVDYEHVYAMKLHSVHIPDLRGDVIFSFTFVACNLVKLAKKVGGFLKDSSEEDEAFASAILLRHLIQLNANVTYFAKMATEDDKYMKENFQTVDPFIGLLCKSCDPNILIAPTILQDEADKVPLNRSNMVTFDANRCIPAGTKLTAYLPFYGSTALMGAARLFEVQRQMRQQGLLNCACDVCELQKRDNPFGANGEVDYYPIGCADCGGLMNRANSQSFRCADCNRRDDVNQIKKSYLTMKSLNFQLNQLVDSIQRNKTNDQAECLAKLEVVITKRIVPLLYAKAVLVAHLYDCLSRLYYDFACEPSGKNNFGVNISKAWDYAEKALIRTDSCFGEYSLQTFEQLGHIMGRFEPCCDAANFFDRFVANGNKLEDGEDLAKRFDAIQIRLRMMNYSRTPMKHYYGSITDDEKVVLT